MRLMAMSASRRGTVALLLVTVALSCPTVLLASDDCVYTVYVRTGSIWRGDTDSVISVSLYDTNFDSVWISNLTQWGGNLQGQDRDYFERGALDIFSGLGDCLRTPICALNLTSDGSGDQHGWYVNYVEVTFTGAHLACNQHLFTIERWLATDTWPYSLTATIDDCERVRSHLVSVVHPSD